MSTGFFPLVFLLVLLFGGVSAVIALTTRRPADVNHHSSHSGLGKLFLIVGCCIVCLAATVLFGTVTYWVRHDQSATLADDAELAQFRAYEAERLEGFTGVPPLAPLPPRPTPPANALHEHASEIDAPSDSIHASGSHSSGSGAPVSTTPAEVARSDDSVDLPSFREEIIDEIGRVPVAVALREQLPEWAAEPIEPTRAGNTVRMVLASERFATVDEAQSQLEEQLRRELMAEMRDEFPTLFREDPDWQPTEAELHRAGVFRRKCLATYPLEVGNFTEPVYQLFWDVELNPLTRQRLYASWRPSVVNTRLKLLCGALAALSIAMGLGAVALRR